MSGIVLELTGDAGEGFGVWSATAGKVCTGELPGEGCRGQIPTLMAGGLGWPSQRGEPWDAGERGWDLVSTVEG